MSNIELRKDSGDYFERQLILTLFQKRSVYDKKIRSVFKCSCIQVSATWHASDVTHPISLPR